MPLFTKKWQRHKCSVCEKRKPVYRTYCRECRNAMNALARYWRIVGLPLAWENTNHRSNKVAIGKTLGAICISCREFKQDTFRKGLCQLCYNVQRRAKKSKCYMCRQYKSIFARNLCWSCWKCAKTY